MKEPKPATTGTAPRTGRGQRRKRDIARRVCAVAEAHVAAGASFSTLSIEQLVAEAGVPRSTFYVYFPDKAAVVRTVLDELGEISIATIASASNVPHMTRAELRRVLGTGVRFYQSRASTFRMLADAAVSDQETNTAYRATVGKVADIVARALAGRRNARRPTNAERARASALVWMLERTLYQELDAGLSADALITAVESVFWHESTSDTRP